MLGGVRGQGGAKVIAERREAPLMVGAGVQIVRDRVGGSVVTGNDVEQRVVDAAAPERRCPLGALRAEGALEPVRKVLTAQRRGCVS